MSKRLKLLYLSQCFPLPLDGGGRIKTFNSIATLSKKFEVFATFVSERNANPEDLARFKQMGVKVKVFKTNLVSESIKDDYLKLAWNYLQLRPHFVYQYRYKPSFSWIKNKIKSWQPDIIHIDHINSAQFLPSKSWLFQNCHKMPKLVLENHNLNHILFATRFKESKKVIRKLYLFLEGSLNWLYGEINYKRFDHIFAISDTETAYLKKKGWPASTQPLVYPLKKAPNKKEKIYDLLFIGYLDWPPNEVAIRWFVEKIFPLINQQLPQVKFHIVGKKNPKLSDLEQMPNVIFHGHQKSLDKFLSQTKIFVLPFQTGAGVRIKSLTALQNGIPIVSTNMGIGGLHLTAGQEYLSAETETEFAKQTIELLKNKQLQEEMSKKQTQYFAKNHSPQANSTYLAKYKEIADKINQEAQ
jgi:glycosyltransferase involved in cell wall biosynthesis